MPRKALDFDIVRQFANELGITPSEGAPAIRFHGKLLAWISPHKSVEPGTLAVSIDIDRRAELIAAAPEVYYLTDHYLNYPTVLVRLSRIHPDALKDLLRMASSFVNKESSRGKRLGQKRRGSDSSART